MRKLSFLLIFVIAVFSVLTFAQEITKIQTIQKAPYDYPNATVTIVGVVTQYEEVNAEISKAYYLRGDFGGVIKILTDRTRPEINERYQITGLVQINARNVVQMVETSRYHQMEDDGGSGKTGGGTTGGGGGLKWYYIAGAAVLLLFIIVMILLLVSKRGGNDYMTPITGVPGTMGDEISNIPKPADVIEGSTIKISAPPPNTLKLLPGKLEVVSGDDTIKEIRFYKLKNQEETEVTFGRGSGPDYSHIQLKPMTVSTKQAKLLWMDKKYTLINYSDVNPTKLNDKDIEKNGSVQLSSGDIIEMGEVKFRFHTK